MLKACAADTWLLIEKVTETGNGKVIVTYAAVDSSNNVAEQSRILKVEK